MAIRFKKGISVVKFPLEDPELATVVKVTKADKQYAYCSDGNKYAQSNGRCHGRCVLGKKDIILLPPFGYSAEEEAEKQKNIATRKKELKLEQAEYEAEKAAKVQRDIFNANVELFQKHRHVWIKAKKIKTVLGIVRLVSLSLPGAYCGEISHNVFMILLNKTRENEQLKYVASGANIVELASSLHNDALRRLFTIQTAGSTQAEAVGAFFSKIIAFEKDSV